MIRDKRSLWPDPEPENTGDWDTDTLFEEDGRSRVGICDRHGCTRWYGPIVVFTVLPQVASTSLDLLQRADPQAFVDTLRLVIRELKNRRASPELRKEPTIAERLAFAELMNAAYKRWGRELPSVSRAFKRLVDPVLWCAGLALPELTATSESQVLRSLGLTVASARALMTGAKGFVSVDATNTRPTGL